VRKRTEYSKIFASNTTLNVSRQNITPIYGFCEPLGVRSRTDPALPVRIFYPFYLKGDIAPPHSNRRNNMLETIAIILLILWGLGLVSSYSLGGFIHVLLVIAIVVILIRVIQGRRI
jgi:hypothetical protein